MSSWVLEYSMLFFINAFSFKFATRWNCYLSLIFCTCRTFSAFFICNFFEVQKWCSLVEPAAALNWFRPKSRVPSLVVHLPRVSYVCLSRWKENDEGDNGMGRTQGRVQQISWHLTYDWGKPQKTSVRKPSGVLSSVTSHCFKWGPFPTNEVNKVKLPAPLAKPIGPSQKSMLKKNLSCPPGRACGISNRFRPKLRVPSLVGNLPRISYVCLV